MEDKTGDLTWKNALKVLPCILSRNCPDGGTRIGNDMHRWGTSITLHSLHYKKNLAFIVVRSELILHKLKNAIDFVFTLDFSSWPPIFFVVVVQPLSTVLKSYLSRIHIAHLLPNACRSLERNSTNDF